MQRILLAIVALISCQCLIAQGNFPSLNVELRSNLQYNASLNDIWGWADPDTGVEYAFVGLQTGLSIVSLEDPDNAQEVHFIPGPSSTWRDIKTWKDHAYVSNETSGGVLVIDLSSLPDSIDYYRWQPNLPELGGGLNSIHNLFVDEKGLLQIAGSNLNQGGIIYADVDTDPHNPVYVGNGPAIYAHDVFTRNDLMYASEIYLGSMTIYDITDKMNPVRLGSANTPSNFTHNIWLSDDSNVAYTTDETGDAPVAAYDVSDPTDIILLDEYRPIGTIGRGVIPHNVHVYDDYLLISYYTDGGRIVDASQPDNLIEVGNFDSFVGGDGGFSGAWGLYPFLPSGTVLVSDIGNGLFVLTPTLKRAARLEGTVTDEVSGDVLADVTVAIDSEQPNMGSTDLMGIYKTGLAEAGTYNVTFSRVGYNSKTVETTLANGENIVLDVALSPLQTFAISGSAIRTEDMRPVGGAQIVITNEQVTYETIADDNGVFALNVLEGEYDIFAGSWGFKQVATTANVSVDQALVVELERGYEDDFILDLGWTVTGDAPTGQWERGEPVGTNFQGGAANPDNDFGNDLGDQCYVTGNAGGGAGADDVDDGETILTSPVMDLSSYVNPTIEFRYWFFNQGGNGAPNDQLEVFVSNGTDTQLLGSYSTSSPLWRRGVLESINEFVELTDNMTVIFRTADAAASGHLVEAGVDAFEVINNDSSTSVETLPLEDLAIAVYPNPFTAGMRVDFDLQSFNADATLRIFNAIGQQVDAVQLDSQQTFVTVGEQLAKGVYFISIEAAEQVSEAVRVIKQ
ncbi:MAG: choice-of-anchor B family protein [Saprospiraceae bacterium]